jgi:hypothetical protein
MTKFLRTHNHVTRAHRKLIKTPVKVLRNLHKLEEKVAKP